jgi:hypothetical protein
VWNEHFSMHQLNLPHFDNSSLTVTTLHTGNTTDSIKFFWNPMNLWHYTTLLLYQLTLIHLWANQFYLTTGKIRKTSVEMKNRHKITHPSNFASQYNQCIQTSRELVISDTCCLMASSSFKRLCWGKVQKLNKWRSLLLELYDVNEVQESILNGPTCH